MTVAARHAIRKSVRRILCRTGSVPTLLLPKHLGDMFKIHSTEGSLARSEAALLYRLASSVSEGCIVEIGSYRGKSTVALGLGSAHGSRVSVYAVEPHEPFAWPQDGRFGPVDRLEFFKNILRAGVGEIVRLVNLPSQQAARFWAREIGLLWINGDHRYEAVRRDFNLWSPFVVEGGTIALHDSNDEGPASVIREETMAGRAEFVRQIGSIAVLRKLRPAAINGPLFPAAAYAGTVVDAAG